MSGCVRGRCGKSTMSAAVEARMSTRITPSKYGCGTTRAHAVRTGLCHEKMPSDRSPPSRDGTRQVKRGRGEHGSTGETTIGIFAPISDSTSGKGGSASPPADLSDSGVAGMGESA